MQIDYYPGCTIKASAGQYEASARAVLRALKVELREMERWHCCGVVHGLTSDNLLHHVAPIRVLARFEAQGGNELLTLCDMCYNTLAQANRLAQQQPARIAALREFLGGERDYAGAVQVLHLLQVLRDRVGLAAIRRRVRRPLRGLALFPYYGCKLLRPGAVGIDDPETPAVLRDLLLALDAEVIDDPAQTRCCGAHHVVNREGLVAGRVAVIVERARARGAAALVLSCPLCHFNLDTRQALSAAALPVLYITQVMGLAFGLEPRDLGLAGHCVDPLPLLIERRLARVEETPV